MLRAEAGRDPYDRDLSDLIGELSTRSDEFRRRWAAHNVRIHTTGIKLLHHPVVGDLDLPFESFPLPADPGQSLLTYTARARLRRPRTPCTCSPAGPRPPTTPAYPTPPPTRSTACRPPRPTEIVKRRLRKANARRYEDTSAIARSE